MSDAPGRRRRAACERTARNVRIAHIDNPTLALTLSRRRCNSFRRRPDEIQDASFRILNHQCQKCRWTRACMREGDTFLVDPGS